MKTLRRFDIRDRYYFVTVVTHERRPILIGSTQMLWECWKYENPLAWVILPDHFHMILKIDDLSISQVMHNFKITFSRHFRDEHKLKGKIWQNRFWDHIIRDQNDMNRHIDYIHYNPVKHKLINDPFKYEHSSLELFYKEGLYERCWGIKEELTFNDNFGE